MTSLPVTLKNIKSNSTTTTTTTTATAGGTSYSNNSDDCGHFNNDDIAISPIEGYSEVKMISSPYSKVAHVDSSGESTPTGDGSNENIITVINNSIIKSINSNNNNNNNNKSSSSKTTNNVVISPSFAAANKTFACNIIPGLNDIPQWKKDLISRRKNNIAVIKTTEAKNHSKPDDTGAGCAAATTFTTSSGSSIKSVTKPSAFLIKLSPVSSITAKSIIPSTDQQLKIKINSSDTLSSSSSKLHSTQSNSSKQVLNLQSLTKDIAAANDFNRESSKENNKISTKVLSKDNNKHLNTSQQEFSTITIDGKKLNKSLLASATNKYELLLSQRDNSSIVERSKNEMPVKFNNKNCNNQNLNNINGNSVNKKYTVEENLILNSPIKTSTSVVKTIVDEITSKGQYTNPGNMINSSTNLSTTTTTTVTKAAEIINYNNMATATKITAPAAVATTTTTTTTIMHQEQKQKIGKKSNVIGTGIQMEQQNNDDVGVEVVNNIASGVVTNAITTNIPPIPKRRTSLNQQQLQYQQQESSTKYYMATSPQTESDNIMNAIKRNTKSNNIMEIELQHIQQMEKQQEQSNISSTEIKEEADDKTTEQQQSLNILQTTTNQLHSRRESGKVVLISNAVDEFVLNKNKILKKSSVNGSNNTNNNYCSNNSKTKEIIILKESINNSVIKSNDDNDGGGNIVIDVSNSNSENPYNLNNHKIKKDLLSESIKNNKCDDRQNHDFSVDESKSCGNLFSSLSVNAKKLSQSSSFSDSATAATFTPSQHHHHHKGYIKNTATTVNKNSTATINKYIAAAAVKNQNITSTNITTSNNNKKLQEPFIYSSSSSSPSLSPSPSSSPKKKISLLNSSAVTTPKTTTTTSTITKTAANTTSSLPSLSLSNYKQQENTNNIIQNLDNSNKMVAVQEIQLKSTNSTMTTTTIQTTAATNGESSNNGESVTTTINNTVKNTATTIINNSNNNHNKRTKMIKNIKNNLNKNEDELNDFDPSEELQYGPGIVSKLRCRYLSLALRQSTGKQRLPLDNLRRATSLNNLLDGSSGSTKVVNGACGTGVIVTTNKFQNITKTNGSNCNTNTLINDIIIDEDNDYEHLIINSNHSHYLNNKSRNQKLLNQQQNNKLSTNLKDIQEQEIYSTIEINSCNTTLAANNDGSSSGLVTNEYVEKPDQQQQKNSFANNTIKLNVQQTSAAVGTVISTGKNSVSGIITEKNILNKTGCNTNNYDQYQNQLHQQQQQYNSNQNANQYIRNTAAAGIIRSGRQVKRGNDSIKRARSVEALLCEKPDIWSGNNSEIDSLLDQTDMIIKECDELKDNDKNDEKKDNNIMSVSAHAALHWNNNASNINCISPINGNSGSPILTEVTIEDKISNAREQRKHEKHPPKRLTSVIDDTERPPPDVVKQTLKIFEASANRRGGRGISKNQQSGHVAMKVANYKSIISQDQKPPISYPKPPLSPKRLGVMNGTSSNCIKSKPNTLNIQNCTSSLTTTNKKFNNNKQSPKVGSPISSLTRRFSSQNSDDSSSSDNANKSPTPLSGIASPTTLRNRNNESTPIRTPSAEIRAPDIIPRKVFETNLGISPVVNTTNNQQQYFNNSAIDSPITQLTKKIDRLKIETSPTPSISSLNSSQMTIGTSKSNYESSKSSESDSTDRDDEHDSYDVTAVDDDDDEDSIDGDDDEIIVKKISKTALENISKAGSSQCFSFKNVKTTPLIGINAATTSAEQIVASSAPKQVGIIRPLIAEPKILTNPTTTTTVTSNLNNSQKYKLKSSFDMNDDLNYQSMQENLSPSPQPQKRNSIGSDDQDDNIVIGNLSQNQLKNDKTITTMSNNSNNKETSSCNAIELNSSDNNISKPALTSREIEKNLINEKKNELANLESSGNSTIRKATSTSTTNNSNNNEFNNWQQQLSQKKKNSNNLCGGGGVPIEAQNNIMVFNFKDRKEVPDYIENDGLFIKRKRELPKPNESGFVLLGDLSLETSTDPDDSWTMGPPSPCNVEFENANIIIDGKSSLRFRSKDGSLRVQFDDTLTSTFEYPSESSLLEDFLLTPTATTTATTTDTFYNMNTNSIDTLDHNNKGLHHHVQVEEILPIQSTTSASTTKQTATATTTTHSKSLGNMTIGSVPLGNYTPVKVQLQRHFELGVTRVPNATDGQSVNEFLLNEQQQQEQQNHSNGHHVDNKISATNSAENNQIPFAATNNSNEYNNMKSTKNGIYSDNIINDDDKLTDSDSLQYLKPATDDLTVVYSEGTQKTDLLY